MKTKLIEATNGFNWGKFAVCEFSDEWAINSEVGHSHLGLLWQCGWDRGFIWVLDLQTGEGIFVQPNGLAKADLRKHKIWVCPMYEPFLIKLYAHFIAGGKFEGLPSLMELTEEEAPSALFGYRRSGSE